MSDPWDVEAAEAVGKAIPNQFSKWSGLMNYVPYIGWILKILGAMDSGATTYSDIYKQGEEKGYSPMQSRMRGAGAMIDQTMGSYQGGNDPGEYGSPGASDYGKWDDYIGDVGSLFSNYQSSQSGGGGGGSGLQGYMGGLGSMYGHISGTAMNRDAWAGVGEPTTANSDEYMTKGGGGQDMLSMYLGNYKQGGQSHPKEGDPGYNDPYQGLTYEMGSDLAGINPGFAGGSQQAKQMIPTYSNFNAPQMPMNALVKKSQQDLPTEQNYEGKPDKIELPGAQAAAPNLRMNMQPQPTFQQYLYGNPYQAFLGRGMYGY